LGFSGENKERIEDYFDKVRSKGNIPYATRVDRAYDELNIIPNLSELVYLTYSVTIDEWPPYSSNGELLNSKPD